MYKQNIKIRKTILLTIYCFISLIVFYRFFVLQVINTEDYKKQAGNNSLRKIITYPPRGIIYDRNNIPLVDNRPLYDLQVIVEDIKDNFNYKLITKYLNISKELIDSTILLSKKIPGGSFKPILLKRNIDFNTKAILEESKLDIVGLHFSELPARVYTSNCNLTHVLGYLRQIDKLRLDYGNYHSNDIIGYSGIEKYYESKLRGKYGTDYFLVDNLGIIQGKYKTDQDLSPVQGEDILLTVDSNIQYFIEKSIEDHIASVILMDPDNGEILALASSPSYDLNSFIGPIPIKDWERLVNNANEPFTNRATQQTYPPGSIIKLLLSAIAIEKDIIELDWTVKCDGIYKFYDTSFRCWKEEGHGEVNLIDAIKGSCNVFFYNLMQQIEFEEWYKETIKFGFGNITGIDLPEEKKGIIPNREYMNNHYRNKGGWSKGHLLNLSIGQGEISVTPIQIIQLINLISTKGKTYKPHLNQNAELEKLELNYKPHVWSIIQEAMNKAVNSFGGTAYNAKIDKKNGIVYGKTGTAQVCSNCDIEPHGWFAGYITLPSNKKYTLCIIIENGGKGSNQPTKLAKKIFSYIIGMDNV